jgi:uncharacterized ParB-like nuclease family protein
MPDDLDDILDRAQAETDRQLRRAIQSLSRCTKAELRAMAPPNLDAEKMEALMEVLADATRSNAAKARAVQSAAGLLDLAIGLAAKVAKA